MTIHEINLEMATKPRNLTASGLGIFSDFATHINITQSHGL